MGVLKDSGDKADDILSSGSRAKRIVGVEGGVNGTDGDCEFRFRWRRFGLAF
jgi:hypothetical protein